jgi:hypothetical protein
MRRTMTDPAIEVIGGPGLLGVLDLAAVSVRYAERHGSRYGDNAD